MITPREPLNKSGQATGFALFALGFRPFFLGAALFSVISMTLWMVIYHFNQAITLYGIPSFTWHAHEMLYGYTMAVIAGFLLTAVRNWTNLATPTGTPLLCLFLLWVAGRVLPFAGNLIPLQLVALVDCLFLLCLIIAVGRPIFKAGNRQNMPIIFKLVFMLGSNAAFYLGALDILAYGIYLGLYSGLYLIIALILTMARRLLPFFAERGVGYPVTLKNHKWLDIGSLVFFLLFWLAELSIPDTIAAALLAAILFCLHSYRLAGWYTPGIWKKPLLWVLYLAYLITITGFALKVASFAFGWSPFLAVHAFAAGIGLMTLGMMARVALGHTGRNVQQPPAILFWMFVLLGIDALVRVGLPVLFPGQYMVWIGLSQVLWIAAFTLFLAVYTQILIRPRVDGQPG